MPQFFSSCLARKACFFSIWHFTVRTLGLTWFEGEVQLHNKETSVETCFIKIRKILKWNLEAAAEYGNKSKVKLISERAQK